MTIPRQRGARPIDVVHHAAAPTPWLDLLWLLPLVGLVAGAVVTVSCWIVDQLSIVDFATGNLFVTIVSGIMTVAALWRWFA